MWWRRKDHGFVHTSYEPKNDNELQLRKGQVVKDIVQIDNEGWYEVRRGQESDIVIAKGEDSVIPRGGGGGTLIKSG